MTAPPTTSAAGPLEPPPRRARLHRRFAVLRWTLVLATVVPSVLIHGAGRAEVGALEHLARSGATVTGHVVGKRVASGRSATHYLTATFEVGGQRFTARDQVPGPRYHATDLGAPVAITYLPTDPATNRLDRVDDERIARTGAAFTWGAVASALAFGCTLLLFERYAQRLLRLARDGRAATATIVAPQRRGRGVHFTFRDANGAERSGRSTFRGRIPPQCAPGAAAMVLFAPERPERSALLASILQVVAIDGGPAPR